MTDPSWEIVERSGNVISPDYLTAENNLYSLTRGDTTTLEFGFQRQGVTDEDTGIYGTGVYGQASYGATGTEPENRYTGWLTLRDYLDYAGAASTNVSLTSEPWYREQLPSDAPVDTLVLKFVPSQELRNSGVEGLWGLVTDGQDTRNPTLTNWTLELEIFVLEQTENVDSYQTLEANHKV